jgi:hypothetical protein
MKIIDTINNLVVKKAYADGLGSSLNQQLDSVSKQTTADGLVNSIIQFAVPLSVTAVVVLLVYAGYMMMTSQGNPDKLQEAKSIITNAIIGFVFILLSVTILVLLSNTLGLNITNN